jgi:hypothetical protein
MVAYLAPSLTFARRFDGLGYQLVELLEIGVVQHLAQPLILLAGLFADGVLDGFFAGRRLLARHGGTLAARRCAAY